MCGPITEEMYEFAKEELETLQRVTMSLHIDRLGVHTTRLQIDSLMEDVRERDAIIEQFKKDFDNYQTEMDVAIVHYHQQMNIEFDYLNARNSEYTAMIAALEVEVRQLRARVSQSNFAHSTNSPLPMSQASHTKLTSIVRGYVARSRVRKRRLKKNKIPPKKLESPRTKWQLQMRILSARNVSRRAFFQTRGNPRSNSSMTTG